LLDGWHGPCLLGGMSRILCPIDLSDISGHVVDHASAMARWYGAQLTLLHVVTGAPVMDVPAPPVDARERARLASAMRQAAGNVPHSVEAAFLVREADSAYAGILDQALESRPDLLVLGTHGRSGFQRLFLGSVTEKVIRKVACPTLVVPPRAADVSPETPVQFRQIVCAVDFSDCSLTALAQALCLVRQTGARLTVLHVIEIPPEFRENALAADFNVDRIRATAEAEALRRLRDLIPHPSQMPGGVTTAVEEGKASREVLRKASDVNADLIVMGVHGRGAMDLVVFGSTTHHVIREARCPVLIVRKA
jgi:nucleotide-binding universal stress UspA family protein